MCLSCARQERERWALWIPVAFGTGIGIYFALPVEPDRAIVPIGVAAAVILGATAARIGRPTARWSLVLLATAVFGLAAAKLHTELVARPVLARPLGPLIVEGRVQTVERRGDGVRLILSGLRARRSGPAGFPQRARIAIRHSGRELYAGEWVRVTAKLMPPPRPAAPGSYDFGRAAFYDGIGAVGYAFGEARVIPERVHAGFIERLAADVELLRARMTSRIEAALPPDEGGIAAALITGDRGDIDPSDTDAYRDAGIAHVLSISGLHLALAGGFFFWLVRSVLALFPAVALNHPIKKWAALAALGGATFYLLISGCDAPAVRSYIMLAMMFGAILADRTALTMRNVALAALIILAARPQSLTEPGFEMSFAAVVALIAFAERGAANGESGGSGGILTRIWRYVADIAGATLVASLATAPIAIFHFDRSTQYGLISNLLTVPLAGFVIMPSATAAMVLMPFHLEKWPLVVMGKGVSAMTAVAHFVASLPHAATFAPAMPVSALVLFVAGGLWMAIWRKTWRWVGIVPILAAVLIAMCVRGPDILVARDAMTVAVRGGDGRLAFLRAPRDTYAAEEWLKRDGDARSPDDAIAGRAAGAACDGYGCVAKASDGTLVAAVQRIDALAEDCPKASIVVSAVPAQRLCRGPQIVIDRFDVERSGGYAIWLGDPPRIVSVEDERGERPWSPRFERRRSPVQYRRMSPTSLP